MTNKASGRSVLLAIGLLLGLATASQAGTDNLWPPVASPQASTTDTGAAPAAQPVASDQLNDVDHTLAPEAQPAQTTATAQPDTQGQSVVPVVASSQQDSSWNMSALIGKIFIGFGTLLTLGSSAARMLMG